MVSLSLTARSAYPGDRSATADLRWIRSLWPVAFNSENCACQSCRRGTIIVVTFTSACWRMCIACCLPRLFVVNNRNFWSDYWIWQPLYAVVAAVMFSVRFYAWNFSYCFFLLINMCCFYFSSLTMNACFPTAKTGNRDGTWEREILYGNHMVELQQ